MKILWHFGPFSLARLAAPTTAAAPAYHTYQLVVQLSSRTSLQLMLVRFDKADEHGPFSTPDHDAAGEHDFPRSESRP